MNAAFIIVINLMRANSLLEERLSGELASVHGVAVGEAMLLLHLERAPLNRLTRIDVAKRLHLNPSTVTRMALPMEKTGLVTRQSDPRDARLAYIALTTAGHSIAREVRATLTQRSADVFRDRWGDEELGTLARLLTRLTVNEPGDLT